jgi:hypothetical protein
MGEPDPSDPLKIQQLKMVIQTNRYAPIGNSHVAFFDSNRNSK